MASPAFVRLGPSSAELTRKLDEAESGVYPNDVELTCAQVPQQFGPGSPIWLWLGSDNNKGVSTDWAQGIRAHGLDQFAQDHQPTGIGHRSQQSRDVACFGLERGEVHGGLEHRGTLLD